MAERKRFLIDDKVYHNPIKEIKSKNIFGWEIGNLKITTKSKSNKLRRLIYGEILFMIKSESRKKKFKNKTKKNVR